MSVLECKNINKKYGKNHVLKDVSFTLHDKEAISILGKSGEGKTTLLRCINGLEIFEEGDILLQNEEYITQGRPIYRAKEIARNIGMVFQDIRLFPNMKCIDNISLALIKNKGISKDKAYEEVHNISAKLNIEAILGKFPDSISGGEAQRVAIARAMILKPKILLLDEITSALDPISQAILVDTLEKIRSYSLENNIALILVTHNLKFALKVSDRILFLHGGNIVENLSTDTFLKESSHSFVREYIRLSI